MIISDRFKHGIVPFIYVVVMGWSVLVAWLNPYYNWDMLCYMGAVVSFEETNPQEVHRRVMEAAKAEIPGWVYEQHEKNMLSKEYTAFMDQVPLCQIKPLYTGAVWLAHKMGLPLAESTWRVSILCYLLLVVVMFLWKPQFAPRSVWLCMAMGITYLWDFPVRSAGHLSTPDAMSTMLVVAAFYLWMQKRSLAGFCICGVMATLARPDAMIIMSAATAYFAVLAPKGWRWSKLAAGSMLVALLISYSAFKMAFGGYTFAQYFIHSLVSTSPHPGQITQELTPQLYWWTFSGALQMFFAQSRVLTLAAIAALALVAYYIKPSPSRRVWRDLLLITVVSWATRFVLWPSWGDFRFYYAYSVMLLYTSAETMGPLITYAWGKLKAIREADLAEMQEKAAR